MIESLLGEIAFVEMPDRLVAVRAVFLEQAGLVLAHAAGDFLDRFVERDIHVLAFGVGLDGDVIGAEEDDFGHMPVFLHVENGFGFDDARVVEMEAFDFPLGVVAEGIGHLFVPHGDGDRQVDVGSLHGRSSFGLGEWMAENQLPYPFVTLNENHAERHVLLEKNARQKMRSPGAMPAEPSGGSLRAG